MLIVCKSDLENIPIHQNNHVSVPHLLESNIAKKILERFFSNPDIIDRALFILRKIYSGESTSCKELDFIEETLFSPSFCQFYMSTIYYKEGVSGILLDGSVDIPAKKIQNILDTLVDRGRDSLRYEILIHRIRLGLENLGPQEEVFEYKGRRFVYIGEEGRKEIYEITRKIGNMYIFTSLKHGNMLVGDFQDQYSIRGGINVSGFEDFISDTDYAIHTGSGKRVSLSGNSEIIEGPRGGGCVLQEQSSRYILGCFIKPKTATIFSGCGKITHRYVSGSFQDTLHETRTGRKRMSPRVLTSIKYNQDTGRLELGYSNFYLFRESDFSTENEKRDFRRIRNSHNSEERGITFSLHGEEVEEVQL